MQTLISEHKPIYVWTQLQFLPEQLLILLLTKVDVSIVPASLVVDLLYHVTTFVSISQNYLECN